jgi:hypothetical protein
METQIKTQIPKAILRKKSNADNITMPDFKLHYRGIVTITVALPQKQNL